MRGAKASRLTKVQCEYKASRLMHALITSCVEQFWRPSPPNKAAVRLPHATVLRRVALFRRAVQCQLLLTLRSNAVNLATLEVRL